jgi:hypothetical protein
MDGFIKTISVNLRIKVSSIKSTAEGRGVRMGYEDLFKQTKKEQLTDEINRIKNKIRELEGCLEWHIQTNERYEKALELIQVKFPVEDVDNIPITVLYEIQLLIKEALEF